MGHKVAICGKIRSGKDTIAKMFINDGYREFKFGTGIAEVIQKYFPEDWAKGKPRLHYQHIGQQLRELDADVWVKYTLKQVDEYLKDNPNGNVIIDDMRQENEAEKLKEAGFIIIKVRALEKVRVKRMLDAGDTFKLEDLYHETEQQVDMIVPDIIIDNDGSLEDLYREVRDMKILIEGR